MEETIQLRGTIPIYYATMSGCSKQIASKFQQQLQNENFIAPLINIGDWQDQQFIQNKDTSIFFISTFGSGGPTQDAQIFYQWIQQIPTKKHPLKNMKFMIFALGNRTFEHFCGHAKKIRQFFINLGAKQINQICLSDANSIDQQYQKMYQKWYPKAIQILKSLYQLKKYPKNKVLKLYQVQFKKINQQNRYWQQKVLNNHSLLEVQCLNFLKTFKAQVIHIKQLRKLMNKEDRSTLWIRIKKPKGFKLTPGCNINVYPENILSEYDLKKQHIINNSFISFQCLNQNSKIKKFPFPEMPYKQFLKIVDFSQMVPHSLIKQGLLISNASQQIKQKYKDLLLQNKKQKILNTISSKQAIQQLGLCVYYQTLLGVNHPRTYTISSWNDQYIDLMVSLIPNGLTSNYFKSMPKYIRIKQTDSLFEVPEQYPLIMISNGTGMAPFRSILEYVLSLPIQKRIKLTLFYGCQRKDDDFYFEQQWKQAQEKQIIKIYVAQSRKSKTNSQIKNQYVQDLIDKNLQLFKTHIFEQNGRIFICGGDQMSKAVKQKLFEVCKMKQNIPFKAYKLYNQLIQKKIIVQQVFH